MIQAILAETPVIIAAVLPMEKLFKKTTPAQVILFIVVVAFLVLMIMSLEKFRQRLLQRRIEREFYAAVDKLKLTREQETLLTQLANRYEVERPVYLLRIARVFDGYAAQEVKRILAKSEEPFAKRSEELEHLYKLRRKLFFVEKGPLLVYKL